MTKIGKILLALPLSLALFACKKNTATKDNTTTNGNITTQDSNPIPQKYRITKEVYDSYFNQTVDKLFAFNITMNQTSTWGEGDAAITYNSELKISKGKMYFTDESFGDTFASFTKGEDGTISYVEYHCNSGSWNEAGSGTLTAGETTQFIFGVSFDYAKLTFDLNENVYKSSEVVAFNRNDSDFEYSNPAVKFENNKLVSLSYHMKQTMYSGGVVANVFIGDVSYTFSNIGTTEDIISPFDYKYVVEKETFDSYFNIRTVDQLLTLNYTLNKQEKSTSPNVTFLGTFAINYGKYLINEYTYYEMSKSSDTWARVKSYHYDKDTHKITSESEFNQDMDYSVNSAFALDWFDFDDFKFNEETKAYECDYVKVDNDTEYYDVKIYFEDNIIKKYTFKEVYTSGSSVSTYQATKTFSNVGTTTINISE